MKISYLTIICFLIFFQKNNKLLSQTEIRTEFLDWTYEETGTPFDTIVCRSYIKSVSNKAQSIELSMQYEIINRKVSNLIMVIKNINQKFLTKNVVIEIKTALHSDTWTIGDFEIDDTNSLRINSFQIVQSDLGSDRNDPLWFLFLKDWAKKIYIRLNNGSTSETLTFSTHGFFDVKSYMDNRLGL